MLPTFFVIGAAKCGTTTLCSLLDHHPNIFMSEPKEPHFFSRHYDAGWKWYNSLFEGTEHFIAVGEGSTSYSQKDIHPEVAKRIYKYFPSAKIIYIVRHPLQRIESQWFQEIKSIRKTLPFNNAVKKTPKLLEPSMYWKQINEFRSFYPDERILVLFLEDLENSRKDVLNRCFDFLGVDASLFRNDLKLHLNPRSCLLQDRWLLSKIRRTSRMDRSIRSRILFVIHDALPRNLRETLKRSLRKPIKEKAMWDHETKKWATDQLIKDSVDFLRFYGKPLNWWDFEAYDA